LIPCHRVIRKTGAFGKYHWGAARKVAMLMRESGARVTEPSSDTSTAVAGAGGAPRAAQRDLAIAVG
jgi:AraC family transcriptional regulator of adaptative response/methylated-DNA-[protein]-cysteine methyltransferase